MPVKAIPDGFHSVTPYLIVKGAAGFIDFLQRAFRAEERARYGEPDGAIMHAEVKIGDSLVMLSDHSEPFPAVPANIHLYVDDVDRTYADALKAGAESTREPTDMPYGDRTAGVRDRWGITWWLATHIEDLSHEEIVRRMQR